MSKKCMVRRETARTRLTQKHAEKRNALRVIINDPNASMEDKEKAQKAMQTLPRDSSEIRRRRRCWMTGRANGVYRIVGLCRNKFREHAMKGDIPGITKSSW